MRFTKMHGLGNDYVFVNAFEESVRDPARLAPVISDRHRGVGGDGLILILPSERADCAMRIFNADGSEAEMCGNGLRCVGKFVHDHGIVGKERLSVDTGAGVLALDLIVADGRCERVRVDMGVPIFETARIPVDHPAPRVLDRPLDELSPRPAPLDDDWVRICELEDSWSALSMGNPHLVLFCRDPDAVPLERLGPALERHRRFPARINVHLVRVHDQRELTMRTWERGSGITQACGTGAAAVAVAAAATERAQRQVQVHLPGGDLELFWDPRQDHVFKTGPATEVFSGDFPW